MVDSHVCEVLCFASMGPEQNGSQGRERVLTASRSGDVVNSSSPRTKTPLLGASQRRWACWGGSGTTTSSGCWVSSPTTTSFGRAAPNSSGGVKLRSNIAASRTGKLRSNIAADISSPDDQFRYQVEYFSDLTTRRGGLRGGAAGGGGLLEARSCRRGRPDALSLSLSRRWRPEACAAWGEDLLEAIGGGAVERLRWRRSWG